ncbi:hypothetical protein KIN20_022239, partial [Parelaphostrongylus tenuis]
TTNIIMTNWSKAMWQNVMNKAIRMLASGPFGSHLFSASGTTTNIIMVNWLKAMLQNIISRAIRMLASGLSE